MAASGRAKHGRAAETVPGSAPPPGSPSRLAAAVTDERLSFERLVADLAAGFVNVDPARLDDAIVDALRRIVLLLGVDRSQLVDLSAPDGGSRVTHAWSLAGVPRVPPTVISHMFPWATAEVRDGRPVVAHRISDLPAAAAVDRQTFNVIGIRSHLSMPMRVGERVVGALAFGCLHAERAWPDDLVARIRVIADVLAGALAHRRAVLERDAAAVFERAVSHFLAALLTAPRADRDRTIERGLRDLAHVFGAERATLWQRSGATDLFSKTHRWLADGAPPGPPEATSAMLPWIFARLLAGRIVRFDGGDDLPPEAASDRVGLAAIGARAALIVPLAHGGIVVGALSFATSQADRTWPAELIPRVRLVGEVLAMVLARDDAERREHEAQAQAAHAARVGAMGVFAASLVHEVTQPLAASLANAETAAELLAEPAPDLDELRATVADIVADDRRASDLIQQLRRFLRRGKVERADIDLRALVRDVLRFVSHEATQRGVRFTHDLPADLPTIVGDRVQLQQVLLNLVSNGIDAVADSGPERRRIDVIARAQGAAVRIEVVDAGRGMDEATLARVFQPFYSTKAGGMGLGLSISRTIVSAHGGTLSVSSTQGVGSVFHVDLPLEPGDAFATEPGDGSRPRAGAAAPAAGNVYVVDDDDSMRRAIERQLEAAGYLVESFASAEAFLARPGALAPGCIVSDLRMPGRSGLDLQAFLAREGRDLPMVFVSGHGDVAAGVQAMRAGAVSYLPKPFKRAALLAAVEEALARGRAGEQDRRALADLRERYGTLTARERDVFELVAEGLLNKTIADRLDAAEATIKIHRGRVMEKMAADSLADLVRMAERLRAAGARREAEAGRLAGGA